MTTATPQLDLSAFQIEETTAEETALIPRVSAATLERLDGVVTALDLEEPNFVCETEADYLLGDATIGRIRQLEKLFGAIYKPEKDYWSAKKAAVVEEEKKRRGAAEVMRDALVREKEALAKRSNENAMQQQILNGLEAQLFNGSRQ